MIIYYSNGIFFESVASLYWIIHTILLFSINLIRSWRHNTDLRSIDFDLAKHLLIILS